MKVILFGATGMVGQGVLRECLLDADVESVLAVGRSKTGQQDVKLREIVRADLADLSAIEGQLSGYDACFFCLGVSSVGMDEQTYYRLTYELTTSIAATLAQAQSGDDVCLCDGRGHRQQRARAHDVGAGEGQDGKRAAADAVQGRLHVPAWLHPAAARDSDEDQMGLERCTR